MTTDAASLHAMVRGYMGEGWWPKGLECRNDRLVGRWWRLDGAVVEPRNAAARIRDAVTEALLRSDERVEVDTNPDGSFTVETFGKRASAPTRLEALLRAWDAVRGREGA